MYLSFAYCTDTGISHESESIRVDMQRAIPLYGGIAPLAVVVCEGSDEARLHAVATLHNSAPQFRLLNTLF